MNTSEVSADWHAGYGVIRHSEETTERAETMLNHLVALGSLSDRERGRTLLHAADRIASQALRLVAHMTYARRIYLDGRTLALDDFKVSPSGHAGDSFSMVIAYVGYLLANALTGDTRAWVMEQGHCVAAIEAVNVLIGNTSAERYPHSDEGLSQLCTDFHALSVNGDGRPRSPLDSHVSAHTAGGVMTGGYPGWVGLQYVHMPLPGQKLVAFLSEAAFEAQRGPDWASRWWRSEDCGLVAPIMIADGDRIDTAWLARHLRLNNFEPLVIDGRDPVAFAWAIFTQERYLEHSAQRVAEGKCRYPVPLPYAIADTVEGFDFAGAGSGRTHALPLPSNPHDDDVARTLFNVVASELWVDSAQFEAAVFALNNHADSGRVRERDHVLAHVSVDAPHIPALSWCGGDDAPCSPTAVLDVAFAALARANPQLRVRVGDPDELRSNYFHTTLDLLKHRVTAPAAGVAEAVDGAVIAVGNEEAVACAALGNKQGLNLIVSCEALAVKLLGGLRQEIIFSRHCKENARAPGWLSVPVLASSSLWENGESGQSHQDPAFAEALLGEMSDVARVLFPVDANSALAALLDIYGTRGSVAAMVVPKHALPVWLDEARARAFARDGITLIHGSVEASVQLLAIGAYQLQQALIAAARLHNRGLAASVWAVGEPGRFRPPRDSWEAAYCRGADAFLPPASQRLLFCHTRPEVMLGTLRGWDLGAARTRALGYINRGGTLDTFGMLYANRCTWAHGVAALAEMREESLRHYFGAREIAALHGNDDPLVLCVSAR